VYGLLRNRVQTYKVYNSNKKIGILAVYLEGRSKLTYFKVLSCPGLSGPEK
jgi:hypothetical protein